MSQGNCIKHININKTLYRAAECPHCETEKLRLLVQNLECAYAEAMAIVLLHEARIEKLVSLQVEKVKN